jgi:hypothetical protein
LLINFRQRKGAGCVSKNNSAPLTHAVLLVTRHLN